MRKKSRTLLAVLTGAILIVTACSDDSMGPNDELTQAEVDEVFAEIFEALGEVFFLVNLGGLPQLAAGPTPVGPALVSISETFDETGPCGGGGTVRVAGSITGDVDEQAGTGTVSFDVTETISNCELLTTGGTTFTVNTSPPIHMTASLSATLTTFTITLAVDGGFTFAGNDGRTGTCTIDISVSATITDTSESQSVTGSVCGRSITEL